MFWLQLQTKVNMHSTGKVSGGSRGGACIIGPLLLIPQINLSSHLRCTYSRAPMVDVSWVSTTMTCSLPSVANLNSS